MEAGEFKSVERQRARRCGPGRSAARAGCDSGAESGRCRLVRADGRELHRTTRHDGGNGVFVDHLRDRVAQQHDVLVERLDLTLQFDAVDQIDRHGHMLPAKLVQERVLQELAFVIAHDMLRVQ